MIPDPRPAIHDLGSAGESPAQRARRHRRQYATDLAILAANRETGWWDERGHPAPWPEDFFDHDSDWTRDDPTRPPSPNPQPF